MSGFDRDVLPRVIGVALALAMLAPRSAHAWTNAAVHHVQARVVVAADASAHVTLTADVRVHGGWLEGLEIAGLDPDLELDESTPPWALDEAGERYTPRAEVRSGGRVLLSFARSSPRRGRVSIGIAYRTSLAHRATEPVPGEPTVRVRWTLPGWRSGLDGVQIELVAPRGARIGPREDADGASLRTDVAEIPEGTLLTWRRAHLPRTLPWTVAVDVPSSAMIPELRGAPVISAPPRARLASAAPARDPSPYWIALAVALALLACTKIAAVERLARRSLARSRPLVPAPALVRAPIALVLAAGAAWIGPDQPWTALALLLAAALSATCWRADRSAASQLGAWRSVDVRWIRAARRARWARFLLPGTLVDATTPLGAALLAAWLTLPWTAGAPLPFVVRACAACLVLPISLSGTRVAFPLGPADALALLLALARRVSRLPGDVALRPVVHVDVRGTVQDARVRTVLAKRPRGLLRLDLTVIESARGGSYEREVALLVLTREGSAAERALAERMPELAPITSSGGRRVVRVARFDLALLARITSALVDCPEAPLASRGTALVEETVRDLPAPRAVGF